MKTALKHYVLNQAIAEPPDSPATVLDYFWTARDVEDTGVAPASGQGITRVKAQSPKTINLDWIGTTTGLVQHQGSDSYGDTDPYPRYWSMQGGFVQIVNTFAQKFESSTTFGTTMSGEINGIYWIRLMGGTDNEALFSVSNGFGCRDRSATNNFESGQFNSAIQYGNGTGRIIQTAYMYKTIKIRFHRTAAGAQTTYINDVAWDGGTTLAVGTNNLSEHVWGGNSHMANVQFFASGLWQGAYSSAKDDAFTDWCEYYHGALGSYPNYLCATFDGSGSYNDSCSWDAANKAITMPTYTYRNTLAGVAEGNMKAKLYVTTTGVRTSAMEQRVYTMTKTKNVDANWNKFFRGTDYGVASGTPTNVYYFIELWAVDANGVESLLECQSQPFLDNIA